MTPVSLPVFTTTTDDELAAAPLAADRSPEAMRRLRDPFHRPDHTTTPQSATTA